MPNDTIKPRAAASHRSTADGRLSPARPAPEGLFVGRPTADHRKLPQGTDRDCRKQLLRKTSMTDPRLLLLVDRLLARLPVDFQPDCRSTTSQSADRLPASLPVDYQPDCWSTSSTTIGRRIEVSRRLKVPPLEDGQRVTMNRRSTRATAAAPRSSNNQLPVDINAVVNHP